MILTNQQINQFKCFTEEANAIVLIPHQNTDGDAIGSILGWWNLFRNMGKTVKVLVPDKVPSNLIWMKGADHIITYETEPQTAKAIIADADLFMFLDFNVISRCGDMAEEVKANESTRVLIDHHPHPQPDIAHLLFSDVSVSSTCELSYLIIRELNWHEYLDVDTSECFYAGIITDTGSLSYNSSHARTYHAVADLVSRGIDKDKIHKKLFQSNSFSRMKLLGHVLCNNLKIMEDSRAAFIFISKEDLDKHNYQPGDTEGFVNYPLGIEGVDISALFTEREKDKFIKISLRSTGNIPINKYSGENFSGGGHTNAAGGEFYGTLSEAVNKFQKTLPGFVKNLNKL